MDINDGLDKAPRGGIILFSEGIEEIEGTVWTDTDNSKWIDNAEYVKWWGRPKPERTMARILIF